MLNRTVHPVALAIGFHRLGGGADDLHALEPGPSGSRFIYHRLFPQQRFDSMAKTVSKKTSLQHHRQISVGKTALRMRRFARIQAAEFDALKKVLSPSLPTFG